jgi:Ca-activated chloride channel family protein
MTSDEVITLAERPDFALAVSQNEYLSIADTEMHAIITVSAHGLAGTPNGFAAQAAEVIAVDCSGSMGHPPTKISAARNATAAAIDALRDGVFFAVVEGTHTARVVYPTEQRGLVAATPETRQAARKAVRHLDATGGTAMGRWLRLAGELLEPYPTAVRHVMLLTDGQNLPDYKQDLDEALAACAGRFVCDGRGIGDDYLPDELQRIVSTLNGSADAILRDSDLVAEFTAMMRAAMSKVVPDVWLRVSSMPFARLRFVKQVFPHEADLTGLGTPVDEHTTAFSTGAWGEAEEREFHVCLEVDRTGLDMHEDYQAAWADLAVMLDGGRQVEQCGQPQPILVHWTDDDTVSSMINPSVAHYTHHTELAAAMKAGRDALEARDADRAAAEWGRAVALAAKLGHEEMLDRLRRLVDIDGDPVRGNVRVKPNLRPRDVFSAIFESVRSTHGPDARLRAAAVPAPGTADRRCPNPNCGYLSPSAYRFCPGCGYDWGETA